MVTVIRTHCVARRASGFVDVNVGIGGAAWSTARRTAQESGDWDALNESVII